MKLIGGETELKEDNLFRYATDSGRSSLRLILGSGLAKKRFLLPNYLCESILKVFRELGVSFDFYNVLSDLSPDAKDIGSKKFEVLYLISYFGIDPFSRINLSLQKGAVVIVDQVFNPVIRRPANIENWIAFNSLRKISPLVEGSLIESTVRLRGDLICQNAALFIKSKYQARRLKYEYLHGRKHSERGYLDLFMKGEKQLNRQKKIHLPSMQGMRELLDFYLDLSAEYKIRRQNLCELETRLQTYALNLPSDYPSFYVLKVSDNQELRKFLFSKKIYLPIHWPAIPGIENTLNHRLISIPIDSRYGREEMKLIAKSIRSFEAKG